MHKYSQTLVDLERAQARQDTPRAADVAIGAVVAVVAVIALVLVLFTI